MTTKVEGFIDVELEIPIDEMVIAKMKGDDVEDEVIRKLKAEAERICDLNKCELLYGTPTEFITDRGIKPETGEEMLLVASRWKVEGPEELFKPRG